MINYKGWKYVEDVNLVMRVHFCLLFKKNKYEGEKEYQNIYIYIYIYIYKNSRFYYGIVQE